MPTKTVENRLDAFIARANEQLSEIPADKPADASDVETSKREVLREHDVQRETQREREMQREIAALRAHVPKRRSWTKIWLALGAAFIAGAAAMLAVALLVLPRDEAPVVLHVEMVAPRAPVATAPAEPVVTPIDQPPPAPPPPVAEPPAPPPPAPPQPAVAVKPRPAAAAKRPTASKPAETKPTESKPAETKPPEGKTSGSDGLYDPFSGPP